jgi:hypothetical protein
MPSVFVQRLLANDPNAAKTLMWLTTRLGYLDMGEVAKLGFHHAQDMHQVCDLLAAETDGA